MGAEKSKQRLEGASLSIEFEVGENRVFDANNPIIGQIKVDSNVSIPAYGI